MPDLEHSLIPVGEVHTPFNWIVNNSSERFAIVPEAEDINKLCLQLDTGESYRLSLMSPITWDSLSKPPDEIDGGTF